MTNPVERLEAWCQQIEHDGSTDIALASYAPEIAVYRAIIADYRNEQEWGNVQKQLHACGGDKQSARLAANRSMYTADGLAMAITRLADALNPEET